MPLTRRHFLCATALLGASMAMRPAFAGRGRVVIVGGGWGGLSAARHLRQLAPAMDVTLVERHARFLSLPLSNQWLTGLSDDRNLMRDYGAAARASDYRFVRAEASAIDRERRRVHTTAGALDYDWLILSVGIRHDYTAWFGEDREAAEHARKRYPAAFTAGGELAALRRKLDDFRGGDFVMTVPPMPYRCPPAPYERALMIAHLFRTRRIEGRLLLLDPNEPMLNFLRIFREAHADRITYVPRAEVRAVDPFAGTISTEFDDLRFDDAILMPPQQAGDLAWQAGLVGRDAAGRLAGWADVDPLHFNARADERVFLVGDAVGRVSTLFGHYPKTGQMAARMGRIAAAAIAARAADRAPAIHLPDSICFVTTSVDPAEITRLDARYRLRGDGEIEQTVRQARDPNPRGEDIAWLEAMFGESLGWSGR